MKKIDKYGYWLLFVIFFLLAGLSECIGQTKEEVKAYLIEIDCKFPEIVTAQSRLESANFTSYNCKQRNNIFGLWNHSKQEYYTFKSWKECCNAYLTMIQYKYKGGDYYEFLERIGYASDKEYINKLKRF